MRSPTILSILVLLLALISAAGCIGTGGSIPGQASSVSTAPSPAATPAGTGAPLVLHAAGVATGGSLSVAYTCLSGMPASPPVSWENVPPGTETLTLILDDPDAPSGTFTHWIVYNIPADRTSISEGQGGVKEIKGGGQQGTNSADMRGYYPACPPIGEEHRYVFTLYAVDYTMGLPIADRDSIDAMLDGHWIEKAIVTTTFSR